MNLFKHAQEVIMAEETAKLFFDNSITLNTPTPISGPKELKVMQSAKSINVSGTIALANPK